MKFYESQRNLLLGGGAAAGVIIFLAIIVGLQYIAIQYPKRWDLTKTGQYTLAPQSKKILDHLRQDKIPVEVLAFYETKDIGARESVRDLLDQYRDVYPDLKYSFIDPDREQGRCVSEQDRIVSDAGHQSRPERRKNFHSRRRERDQRYFQAAQN